jgi:hypothetical protein
MIRLFLFIVLLFTISACSKSAKPTSIIGRVLTYGTDEVIDHPAVLVQLYRRDYAGCWGCGYSYEVIDEAWSDEKGLYQLQGNLYDDESYYLGVSESTVKESKGYLSPWDKDLDEYEIYSRGSVLQMDYHLVARGWVRFHFDISGLQPNDRFAYNVGGGGFESFTGNVQIERIWDFGGNFEHSISLEMRIDGEWSNWKEYFFVPAFDTIDYEIHF